MDHETGCDAGRVWHPATHKYVATIEHSGHGRTKLTGFICREHFGNEPGARFVAGWELVNMKRTKL